MSACRARCWLSCYHPRAGDRRTDYLLRIRCHQGKCNEHTCLLPERLRGRSHQEATVRTFNKTQKKKNHLSPTARVSSSFPVPHENMFALSCPVWLGGVAPPSTRAHIIVVSTSFPDLRFVGRTDHWHQVRLLASLWPPAF